MSSFPYPKEKRLLIEVFLGISETVGHLEILREKERVKAKEKEMLREPLIISNSSLPPRIPCGVNSGGSLVMSKAYGFLPEFTPMQIGAGMTCLEGALRFVAYG